MKCAPMIGLAAIRAACPQTQVASNLGEME